VIKPNLVARKEQILLGSLGLLSSSRGLGSGGLILRSSLVSGGSLGLRRGPEGLAIVSNCRPKVVCKACRVFSYEVVTEELHDEGRILVALLAEGVKLCIQLWSVHVRQLRPI
jgi:hypothetical protein